MVIVQVLQLYANKIKHVFREELDSRSVLVLDLTVGIVQDVPLTAKQNKTCV